MYDEICIKDINKMKIVIHNKQIDSQHKVD